jgi:urease accessory protein
MRVTSIKKNSNAKFFTQLKLDAQSRHIRRKVISLGADEDVLVDFALATMLEHGDHLVLEDGRAIAVLAADEELMEVRGRDAAHLTKLAWHIGNRHLDAQIEPERILLRRDHVIAVMLEQLGGNVRMIIEPFAPEHGAYHAH